MSRDLLLLGIAREGSIRLENKMLRPFGNTTLFNIYIEKLEQISRMPNSPFSKVVLALNKNDKNLWRIANDVCTRVIIEERDDFSVRDATKPVDLFHFLNNYDESHFMRVSACFPFLKPETIVEAAQYFKHHKDIKTMTAVKECRNWFWNPTTNEPITLLNKTFTTTQQSKMLYQSVHCFHILNRQDILNDILWNLKPNDPYLYVVTDSIEFLDIDTEAEFQVCEAVWKVYEELWRNK